MAVERADADLDEAAGEAALHDPGEGRGVGARIAFEIVVEVGMGVEMEDVDRLRERRRAPRSTGTVIEWSPPRTIGTAPASDAAAATAAAIKASSPSASVSARSPASSRRMSRPSSAPDSAAELPWLEWRAARISGGASGGAAQEGGMAVGRGPDQPKHWNLDPHRPHISSFPAKADPAVPAWLGPGLRRGTACLASAEPPLGPDAGLDRILLSFSRMTMLQPPRPDRADARPGFREFVVLMAGLMALNALAIDAMVPALPAIGEALHVLDENQRQLVVSLYVLGFG
jgi:hypothetical protein